MKMLEEGLTVLFTCNATSDCCMKPLVTHQSARNCPYQNSDMSRLSVYWEQNKVWMMSALATKWFDEHFVPDEQLLLLTKEFRFESYCATG